jgi:enoyl-CoA hydratase/carnithine racemase
MPYDDYPCLSLHLDRGVLFATIDHPPLNLLDLPLMQDLDRLGRELEADAAPRVVVFRSANPDYFIAHADVTLIQTLPREAPPRPKELGPFHRIVERFRTLPKVTIGEIEGRARGGGSEFLLSLDMRFGAIDRAVLGQPEVALGIIPGGSGTQRLPRLVGRGRALEVILGCEDFDAELAERYGYVNRALPPAELRPFVDGLARRIASFPAEAIALAKASVDAAEGPLRDGLLEEQHNFDLSLETHAAQARMQRFMEIGGQQPENELSIDGLLARLQDAPE